jgi:hypothetical protein
LLCIDSVSNIISSINCSSTATLQPQLISVKILLHYYAVRQAEDAEDAEQVPTALRSLARISAFRQQLQEIAAVKKRLLYVRLHGVPSKNR